MRPQGQGWRRNARGLQGPRPATTVSTECGAFPRAGPRPPQSPGFGVGQRETEAGPVWLDGKERFEQEAQGFPSPGCELGSSGASARASGLAYTVPVAAHAVTRACALAVEPVAHTPSIALGGHTDVPTTQLQGMCMQASL